MARVRPILDRIALILDPVQTVSDGGIILPDTPKHEHPPKSGTIVAVGPGAFLPDGTTRKEMSVKVGDRILFTGYAGKTGPWDDKECTVITEDDVLFIYDE